MIQAGLLIERQDCNQCGPAAQGPLRLDTGKSMRFAPRSWQRVPTKVDRGPVPERWRIGRSCSSLAKGQLVGRRDVAPDRGVGYVIVAFLVNLVAPAESTRNSHRIAGFNPSLASLLVADLAGAKSGTGEAEESGLCGHSEGRNNGGMGDTSAGPYSDRVDRRRLLLFVPVEEEN